MINSIQGLWREWEYARGIGYNFLSKVNNDDLTKLFPRENYNTILAQYNELYEIQQDYVDAIDSGSIQFKGRNLHLTSAAELINKMKELDGELKLKLETINGDEYISWWGDERNIHQHICAMISHEMLHVGQVVAFCYAVNIKIPEEVVNTIHLDG